MRARLLAIAFAFVFTLPGAAHAAWMAHYDLTGLLLQSDAVVLADRGATAPGANGIPTTTYRVTRLLRGTAPAVGTALPIWDQLYADPQHPVDTQVVLFLHRGDGGTWDLVSSGMRVTVGGHVYRFEQWQNPGGWTLVPQGEDPADARDSSPDAQPVTRDAFFAQLTSAGRRADALTAAARLTDIASRRRALFALLGPACEPGASRGNGFYMDEVATRVELALLEAGDVDGALEASTHNASTTPVWLHDHDPPVATLLARAADASAPLPVRVGALRMLGAGSDVNDDEATPRAIAALLADPSADVRRAAVFAVAHTMGMSGGSPADDARFRRIAARSRTALLAAWSTETSPNVLYELAHDLEGERSVHLGAPAHGPHLVARAELAGHVVRVHAIAATRGRVTDCVVVAIGARDQSIALDSNCQWTRLGGTDGGGGGGSSAGVPPEGGRYALALELRLAGARPLTAPLGTLVIDAAGAWRIEPAP